MIDVDVRVCTAEDFERLLAREPIEGRRSYERDRYEGQELGRGLLLVAWEGDVIRGRTVLFRRSKYDNVLDALGTFPEINALDAWPTGEGIGSQILAASERFAIDTYGADRIGIAVDFANVDANRLYERVGYERWGEVIDEWNEVDATGAITVAHHDVCQYLVKALT